MKKVVCIVLLALLALALVSCPSPNDPEVTDGRYVGLYKIFSVGTYSKRDYVEILANLYVNGSSGGVSGGHSFVWWKDTPGSIYKGDVYGYSNEMKRTDGSGGSNPFIGTWSSSAITLTFTSENSSDSGWYKLYSSMSPTDWDNWLW